MRSTSGLNEIDFIFCGILWRFIDSTGFVVPGKSSHSSGVIKLYTLLNFFNTCDLLHQSVQVTVSSIYLYPLERTLHSLDLVGVARDLKTAEVT